MLPPAIRYQNTLIQNIKGLKDLGLPAAAYSNQQQILESISKHIGKISELVEKMIEARKVANNVSNTRTKAIEYNSQVKEPYFDEIRYHADKLELLVDDQEWVLTKYRELLFLR